MSILTKGIKNTEVKAKKETKTKNEIKKEESKVVKAIEIKTPEVVKEESKVVQAIEVKKEIKEDILESEKASKIINELVNKYDNLKIIGNENVSGTSYFSGRTRIFKLLKSKKGISLEINVQLDKEFTKDIQNIEHISIAMAHSKHMGTMKHHYRSSDTKELNKIITKILETFKESKVKEKSNKKSIEKAI